MIITRSPLRISLGGGGTDLPSYYREHEGFLIAAAIDKYVYITVHDTFQEEIILKYSRLERVTSTAEIEHPIMRNCLELIGLELKGPELNGRNRGGIEIASMADIPAGTGLGSSGSFTTALLKALHTWRHHPISPAELAAQACHVEIDRLGEPIGKQDQYIAAHGGITCFDFRRDDTVEVRPLKISSETRSLLEDHLLLFFTGYSRSASSILKEQNDRSRNSDAEMTRNLHYVKDLGLRSRDALVAGDICTFVELMNVHWEYKKRRSGGMSNAQIDQWYALARENGALCGKLIGAGGGGFLMFYAEDPRRLRAALATTELREVRFRFDYEGTRVVVQ